MSNFYLGHEYYSNYIEYYNFDKMLSPIYKELCRRKHLSCEKCKYYDLYCRSNHTCPIKHYNAYIKKNNSTKIDYICNSMCIKCPHFIEHKFDTKKGFSIVCTNPNCPKQQKQDNIIIFDSANNNTPTQPFRDDCVKCEYYGGKSFSGNTSQAICYNCASCKCSDLDKFCKHLIRDYR